MFNFESIKSSLLKKKVLFEDDDFPASGRSIGSLDVDGFIVWKRPKDILPAAKFIVNGISRFDLIQGSIADCWFISAAACLAAEHAALLERCVPVDQSFDKDYAGIFLFRFWNFGSWDEVYIDDRLPTVDGKLVFAHNVDEPNEFWVPLFEKAYAKLKGSYASLNGGQTTYALVDFTGGITERIDLKFARVNLGPKLFDVMMDLTSKSSLMGCEINSTDATTFQSKLPSGLYMGHAYSITKVVVVQTKVGKRPVKLLRIRNPWGEGEWNGDWSDDSPRWSAVSEEDKNQLQMMRRDNGEFWMSYEDWVRNFEYLTICHLEPDAITAELERKHKKTGWEVISFHSEWIKGYNANGSSVFSFRRDKFFSNPQFRVSLTPPSSSSSSSNKCHMIVSLMQMTKTWDEQNFISFDVYMLKPEAVVQSFDYTHNYTKDELQYITHNEPYINLREVTKHLELPPGEYVIIPHTHEPNKVGQFLLRVYTEVKVDEDAVDGPTNILPQNPPASMVGNKLNQQAQNMFQLQGKNIQDADARELMLILDAALKKDGLPGFTSMEAARCLISAFGKSKPGFVTMIEFILLWTELGSWIAKFQKFDNDRSGTIDCNELDKVYTAIGVQVSRNVVDAVVCKYGGRTKDVTVDEFILCSSKIKNIYDYFKKLCAEGKLKMNLEEWMSMVLSF